MKKLNIQRDLNSRAAISEKRRRTHSVAQASVEPVKPETHPQSGTELRKTSRKVRKTEGNV